VRRILIGLSLAGVALVLAGSGTSASAKKERFQLQGEVYPNSKFKIEMENKAGKDLKKVKAGTYRIKIEDKATIHNFHLMGPGVNKKTSISGRTETIWTVHLRRGTYKFRCDPHPTTMRGSFRVT
jgi:plastocyanin